ncbi:hypothetical protein [Pseudomonas alkylphenolica]|nr:hypothetical protein [Pseudomonas alkylphenolica]
MIISIADSIFLAAGLLNISGIAVLVGVVLHLGYTKMDVMLEHLKNCPAVKVHIPLKNGGPWGKFLLVGWIAGVVTFPGFYLKHGGVSINDLNNFPGSLKRKLVLTKWAAIVLSGTLILLFLLRETGTLK